MMLLVLLLIIKMHASTSVEPEGIMVSFGETLEGGSRAASPSAAEEYAVSTKASEKILTQKDPSVSLDKKTDNREQERELSEKKRLEQEAISKANIMEGIFDKKISGNENVGDENLLKGNPAGRGTSNGNSWSLSGRNLVGNLITPRYEQNVEGEVTVNIRVDENGVVEGVSIGVPTNISDATILKAAMEAAKNTRFSPGKGKATGTITYHFRLK